MNERIKEIEKRLNAAKAKQFDWSNTPKEVFNYCEDATYLLSALKTAQARAEAAIEDMRVCAYDEGNLESGCICNICKRKYDCPDEHRGPEELETRCYFIWRGLGGE